MELKDMDFIERNRDAIRKKNPFNGIESYKLSQLGAHRHHLGIHSMELKVTLA